MKEYENLTRFNLSKEYPMIIRLDGNAFHTFPLEDLKNLLIVY